MLAVSPAVPLLLVGICLGAAVVGFLIWVSLADRAKGAAGTSGGTTEDDSISTAGTDG